MEGNIGLQDGVELFLSGKRDGTVQSYGYFLRNFTGVLRDVCGFKTAADVDLDEVSNMFEKYCSDRKYRDSTVRSFRYGLRSYLAFLGIDLGTYTLVSEPWEERIGVITEPEFDRFRAAIGAVCTRGEGAEIALIACLAYYCGLTLNEILKLNVSSFYRFGETYHVHVTGVSRKDKDRVVEVPDPMVEELQKFLEKDPHPLFTLGRKEDAAATFDAEKRKLQRTIAAASQCMEEDGKAPKRYDLKALRSSRIYLDVIGGRSRKEVVETYGVSEYYVSHLLKGRE